MNAATTTTPATVTCCYEGCDRVANETDSDGDRCCERCYWQHDIDAEFVELHNLVDGAAFDAEMARRYETLMSERGWTVTVREPRRGEIEGHTYTERGDGTLQIQLPRPGSYDDDSRVCYEAVLSGADKRECEKQASEDIAAAFGEWDRERPLAWTADELVSYWTDERDSDERAATIRDRREYARAVERILPGMLATERLGFEQRAAAYYVARISLPGSARFSYSVHDSADAAGEVIEAFEREADTEELRNAARQSSVLSGPACLWDTYQDGRLIYADLVRAL